MFFEGLAASLAMYSPKIRTRGIDLAIFVSNMPAPFTFDKRLTLANSQNGDEKERQIIINADEIGLAQAAVRADAGMAFQFFSSRSHTSNENHEPSPHFFQFFLRRQSSARQISFAVCCCFFTS
jgi:hypothetical protein